MNAPVEPGQRRQVSRGLVPGGCAGFVQDQTSPFKALVGGMGSGKTDASVANTLIVGAYNAPLPYLYVEPTYDLIRTVALPTFRRVLDQLEVPHVWHDRDRMLVVGAGSKRFPIMMRSGDDPQKIMGFEAGAANIDEAARQKPGVWKAVVQRCRAPGSRRKVISMTSSPEGHNWFYRTVQAAPPAGMKLYRARTADNPFIAPSYVANMKATMTESEFLAYAEGHFVNLTTGLVYQSFSRERHNKRCANPLAGEVIIGCDFNVTRMHWIIGRRLFDEIHVWGEIVGKNTNTYRQTEALAAYMRDAYRSAPGVRSLDVGRWFRSLRAHTDATGSARKTSASESDVEILRRAGLSVREATTNPPIKDRVYSVEQMLRAGKLLVDCDACPVLTQCLEGQGWGPDGLPEKGRGEDDLSGGVDALGYAVWGFHDLQATWPAGNRTIWSRYT